MRAMCASAGSCFSVYCSPLFMCSDTIWLDASTNQMRSASLVTTVGFAASVTRYVSGQTARAPVGILPSDGATIATGLVGVVGATWAAGGALAPGVVPTTVGCV